MTTDLSAVRTLLRDTHINQACMSVGRKYTDLEVLAAHAPFRRYVEELVNRLGPAAARTSDEQRSPGRADLSAATSDNDATPDLTGAAPQQLV